MVAAGRRTADRLLARRPTGVTAVNSAFRARQYEQLTAGGIPMVVLDPTGEPTHSIPSVGATNWSGGIAAARHLLDLGHRRIGVITGPMEYLCARARSEAARGVLEAAGLPPEPALVRRGRFHFNDGMTGPTRCGNVALRSTNVSGILRSHELQSLGPRAAHMDQGHPPPPRRSFHAPEPTLRAAARVTRTLPQRM
jgi:LacI family xylobiose transport system transcriptional regulator